MTPKPHRKGGERGGTGGGELGRSQSRRLCKAQLGSLAFILRVPASRQRVFIRVAGSDLSSKMMTLATEDPNEERGWKDAEDGGRGPSGRAGAGVSK